MGLEAGYLELEADELAQFLLKETGQIEHGITNPASILQYLKLTPVVLDLEASMPGQVARPRGVLSFGDRIVGIHTGLMAQRARFTVLHEVAHYVLPQHQNILYVCGESDLSFQTRNALERQASEFAADLLFQGDRFTLEANSERINATTIKRLGDRYQASYEATARRLAAKSFHPCMLVAFQPEAKVTVLDPTKPTNWIVRYAVPSPAFANRYFSDIKGTVPEDVARTVTQPGRDVVDSVVREFTLSGPLGEQHIVKAEFFCNTYNIFAMITPADAS